MGLLLVSRGHRNYLLVARNYSIWGESGLADLIMALPVWVFQLQGTEIGAFTEKQSKKWVVSARSFCMSARSVLILLGTNHKA